jgi:hypothetical protein
MQSAHTIEDALQIFAALFINVEDSSTHSGTVIEKSYVWSGDTSDELIYDDDDSALSKSSHSVTAQQENTKFLQSSQYIVIRESHKVDTTSLNNVASVADTLNAEVLYCAKSTISAFMYHLVVTSSNEGTKLVYEQEKSVFFKLDRLYAILRASNFLGDFEGASKFKKTLANIRNTTLKSFDGTLSIPFGGTDETWTISTHTCSKKTINFVPPAETILLDTVVVGMLSNMFDEVMSKVGKGYDFFYDPISEKLQVSFALHALDSSSTLIVPFVVLNNDKAIGVKPDNVGKSDWDDTLKMNQSVNITKDRDWIWDVIN